MQYMAQRYANISSLRGLFMKIINDHNGGKLTLINTNAYLNDLKTNLISTNEYKENNPDYKLLYDEINSKLEELNTKKGGGKRKPKRKSRKSHKKKRKSKRKSRKSRKSRKTKRRRR